MTPTVKFSIILIFFCIALFSRFFCYSKKEHTFLTLGMFFTLLADYFLVLAGNEEAGVLVFCLVHVAYILRVFPGKYQPVTACNRLIFLAAVPIFVLAASLPLAVLAAVYALLFAANIALNIKYAATNRVLILSGLALFALCDINVLLFNLPRFVPDFPAEISRRAFELIWLFYVPGQLLLCVSAIRWKP